LFTMTIEKGDKFKLLKGLTEHDILAWEEEKSRFQRKVGRKVTDLEFLRHLLVRSSRPLITKKDGVTSSFLTGQGPIYEKDTETVLTRYRSQGERPRQ
jgi:cAMP phosphodiesterase